MNKNIKKVLLCLLLPILLIMGACSSIGNSGSKDKSELLTFGVYLNYSWWSMPTFDETNKISKWIMDNKGFKINFSWPTGNETDRLNTMIASDSLPDVIVMDRGDMVKKLVQLNKLVPLDDYINKYDGYKSMVDETAINLSKINGKIYGLLNWPMSKDWLGFGTGMYLDAEIYKGLGSPKLDTLMDLENYLLKVKNAKLIVNGKSVVPLQSGLGGVNTAFLWSSWGEHRTDAAGMSTRPINKGKLALSLTDPKYAEFVSYVNGLYTKGLINSDCFVESKEQIKEKILTKRAAVLIPGGDGDLNALIYQADNEAQKTSKALPYILAPVLRANSTVNIDTIKNSGGSTLGWNNVVITTSAKEPEKIYKALDWLASEEGQRVILFGPKGELWDEVDKTGAPILKDGMTLQQTAEEAKLLPLQKYGIVSNGPFYDHAKINMNNILPADKQDVSINDQANFLYKLTWNATEFNDLTPAAGTTEAIINTDVANYLKDSQIKIIMASNNKESLKVLKETITEIYAKGYKKVEDLANTKWQENLKAMK